VRLLGHRFRTNMMGMLRNLGSRALIYPLVVLGFLLSASAARANDIYLAQNLSGAGNGADCADALAVSWFNSSANWGGGTNQIGPGTTVHLCGTITGAAGSTGLDVLGNGTSTSPITILFETGAVLQAPYWAGPNLSGMCNSSCGGAIDILGFSYITIDGGTNGLIQNTANGTSLANHQNSVGIYLNGSNLIVRNLAIQSIYMNQGSSSSATDTAGENTADIRVDKGSPNISIYNNKLNDARVGIWSDSSGSGVNYYNNTIQSHCWHISLNGSGSPNVYNNDISDWTNWFYPNAYHQDGIIVYGDSTAITPFIYNNYIHGDLIGASPTGFIFCTYGATGNGSASSCTIFNNLLVGTGNTATRGAGIYFHSGNGSNSLGPHFLYNNTFVGFSFMIYAEGDSTIHYTIQNNVFFGNGSQWYLEGNTTALSSLTSDHNDFYGGRSNGPFSWGSVSNGQFSNWQSMGKDTNGSNANPGLDSTYHLQANSPVISLSANLTGLNIAALNIGKPSIVGVNGTQDGVARSPITPSWSVGAYPFSSSTASRPAPPQGLSATVN
jgi:hypothetical protein